MEPKEVISFVSMQEQLVYLLLRVKVLETILTENNIISSEQYGKKLEEATKVVLEQLKPAYDKINELQDIVKNLKANKSVEE
jgi:predicted transcriptional regulator